MEGRLHKTILITPLERPEGLKILAYRGFASNTVVDVIPAHHELKTLFTAAKGVRSPISRFIDRMVGEAVLGLEEKAKMLGGNAILGLRINVVYLGWGRIAVTVYGTVAEVEE